MTDLLPVSERRALQRTERRTDPAVDRDIGATVEQRARVVLDTSVLIADPDCFSAFEAVDIVVPLTVIEELDGLKTRIDDVGRAARAALRGIEELRVRNGGSLAHPVPLGTSTLQIEINGIQKHRLLEHGLDPTLADNRIIGAALGQSERAPTTMVSNDAALRIKAALAHLNEEYESEFERPLRIAMSLHAGPAIVGQMGYGQATSLTAVGDTINAASRLEGLAKELDVELVISEDLATRAGLDLSDRDRQIVQIRGRAAPLGSWIIPEADSLGR